MLPNSRPIQINSSPNSKNQNSKPTTMKISLCIPGLAVLATSLSSISCVSSPTSDDGHTTHSHTHAAATAPSRPSETPAPSSSSSSAKVKPYPLNNCLVSDEELDSMGGPITKVHQGQEVKFCCKGCVRDFDASPEEYLAKLK